MVLLYCRRTFHVSCIRIILLGCCARELLHYSYVLLQYEDLVLRYGLRGSGLLCFHVALFFYNTCIC